MKSLSISLTEIAKILGAKLQTARGGEDLFVSGVADLESATPSDVSFLANPRYASLLKTTQAGLICVDESAPLSLDKNYLISASPSDAFQQIATLLLGKRETTGFSGIHPTAVIHPSATLGQGVTLSPYAIIDEEVEVGHHSIIGPFVYLGKGSKVGAFCHLHAHSVVREYCSLGSRVILQPGAVIGSCGFGYLTNAQGEHTKLEQLGNVILEDDVEIGANTTIDRARFKTTRVGKGTKIDNLVQIAHNVELGQNNILAAQTGLAGSTKTGRSVMMGGQVGVVGHLEITDFVMIATRGGVSKSIKQSGKYAGSPVIPLSEYNRSQVQLRRIGAIVAALENRLSKLEEKSGQMP